MPNFYKLAAILGSPNLLHLRAESRRERMILRFDDAITLLRTRACLANPFCEIRRKAILSSNWPAKRRHRAICKRSANFVASLIAESNRATISARN